MNLHRSQLAGLAKSMVDALSENGHIEVKSRPAAAADLEAVLIAYVDQEKEVVDRARDFAQQRGLAPDEAGRFRHRLAEQRGIKVGDEGLDYVLDQLIEMLMHSEHVDEVFGQDHDLRRTMRTFILEAGQADEKIEAEVRSKLKHVEEGSRMWEIEYRRMKEDIKRRRGV